MTFRKAQRRKNLAGQLKADLAFKCYVMVALLSTSGLDTLLFVTLILLAVAATALLVHGLFQTVLAFSSSAAQFEADSA